jgi:MFS family permease
VSTAGSLPLLLFSVAAGAIGDLVDWRRLLLVAQGLMLAAAAPPGGCLQGAAENLVAPRNKSRLCLVAHTAMMLRMQVWTNCKVSVNA